jgi:hypothetical protein
MSSDELRETLTRIAKLYPDQPVVLRGDENVNYRYVVDALDICRAANIWNVAFATSKPSNARQSRSLPSGICRHDLWPATAVLATRGTQGHSGRKTHANSRAGTQGYSCGKARANPAVRATEGPVSEPSMDAARATFAVSSFHSRA